MDHRELKAGREAIPHQFQRSGYQAWDQARRALKSFFLVPWCLGGAIFLGLGPVSSRILGVFEGLEGGEGSDVGDGSPSP